MITAMSPAVSVIQAILWLDAATSLNQSSVNIIPKLCRAREDYGPSSAMSLSFFQKSVMKKKSEEGHVLLQEYSQEHSLLQEKRFLSKTEDVWDEDDEPISALGSVEPVDPVESLLEALDVPVTVDAAPWPGTGTAASSAHSEWSESAASSLPPALVVGTNASWNNNHIVSAVAATHTPPALKLKKDAAVPWQEVDLRSPAEAESQPQEVVDPPSLLFQEVPLARHERVPLSDGSGQTDFIWSWPRSRLYTMLCIVALVGVMLFAACPRSSTEVESQNLGGEAIKVFYDEKTQQYIEVEVVGKLKSGRLLLRRRSNSTLFTVKATSKNLSSTTRLKMKKYQIEAENSIAFPAHQPYDPNHPLTIGDMAQAVHWRLKEMHENIVGIANRGRQKNQKGRNNDDAIHQRHSQPDAIHTHIHESLWHDLVDEVEEDMAEACLAVEDMVGEGLEEIEEEAAKGFRAAKGATVKVGQTLKNETEGLEKEAKGMAKGLMKTVKKTWMRVKTRGNKKHEHSKSSK